MKVVDLLQYLICSNDNADVHINVPALQHCFDSFEISFTGSEDCTSHDCDCVVFTVGESSCERLCDDE